MARAHLVPGDDRDAGADAQHLQRRPALSSMPLVAMAHGTPARVRYVEQLARAGQRPHLRHQTGVRLRVVLLEPGGLLAGYRQARLAQERVHEQAAAHPDAAVDAPDGERDPLALQRLAPGEHVLVDAVDQGAVEVEEEGGGRGFGWRCHAP